MSEAGKRIQDTMQEKRLSFSDLSTMTGISKTTIQRYASGKTNKIPADRLTKIAAALGTTSGALLGDVSLLELVAEDNGMSAATAMFERQRKGTKPMNAAEADKWDKIFSAPKQENQAAPSGEETRLVDMYREMNQEGQEKLLDYADDMVRSGKYIKTGSLGVVDKEA